MSSQWCRRVGGWCDYESGERKSVSLAAHMLISAVSSESWWSYQVKSEACISNLPMITSTPANIHGGVGEVKRMMALQWLGIKKHPMNWRNFAKWSVPKFFNKSVRDWWCDTENNYFILFLFVLWKTTQFSCSSSILFLFIHEAFWCVRVVAPPMAIECTLIHITRVTDHAKPLLDMNCSLLIWCQIKVSLSCLNDPPVLFWNNLRQQVWQVHSSINVRLSTGHESALWQSR